MNRGETTGEPAVEKNPYFFDIDEDITRAWTLPAVAYTDPVLFEQVANRVFRRSWHLVATTDDVSVPGQVLPVTLLEGCLDEPLLITRDQTDVLHCVSNVCTHRGTILCENAGVHAVLTCRYHGRRFQLDGTVRSMPEFEGVDGFPAESDHLPKVPFGVWGKFAFASLDPDYTLDELIGPVKKRVPWVDAWDLVFDASRSRDYLVQANWALYCDNYLEGFHIPYVHSALNAALDYGEYTTELQPRGVLQLGVAKGAEDCFDLPPDSPDHDKRVAAYYFWLFPNCMLNVYPWGISVNIVQPLAIDRTRIAFRSYVADPSRLDRGAGAGLDRVEREDEAIVEAVQRGMRASLYSRGRYSPTRERGVHHFHRLLASALEHDPM
jgi:choline monooxygenase